jgi:hypothetical protein
MMLPLRSEPVIILRQSNNHQRRAVSGFERYIFVLVQTAFVLLLCGSSYLAGSIYGHNATTSLLLNNHGNNIGVGRLIHHHDAKSGTDVDCTTLTDEQLIEIYVKREVDKHNVLHQAVSSEEKENLSRQNAEDRSEDDDDEEDESDENDLQQMRRFPKKSMGTLLNGMVRIKKDNINEYFDFGNPVEAGVGTSTEDVLMLYQKKEGLPTSDKLLANSAVYNKDGFDIPLTDTNNATENCDTMNVIFTNNPGNVRQCTAIIGNFESYHIQRWMKVDTITSSPIKSELPLVPVSRGYMASEVKGRAHFYAPPYEGYVTKHWDRLLPFFENVDTIMKDLDPLLQRIARNNAIVVLTCNMGQSALLINFACSARRRGFDLGHVLVFPSDLETKQIAEGLGLATYYDEKNLGKLPKGQARRYGDRIFSAMMYAKVLCVLYPLLLGYDVLFQDVDIVWLNSEKDPLEYFQNQSSNLDVIFQHDGSNSLRYAPYSANSGFYYVRATKKSQYLFTSLLFHADLIITWDSHQQVLVQLLSEHSSLFGLNVKVINRDTEMFPGGWHYHRNHDFMKKFVNGETDSYIFHMSWTENKDDKLLFLRQLGEWYVTDQCIRNPIEAMIGTGGSLEDTAVLVQPCCAMEPIFSCHYRDKPSKLPCESSEPIDKFGRSFW